MKKIFIISVLLIIAGCAGNKADKFFEQGDYDAAIAEAQTILKSDSLNINAYFILGKCYQAKKELRESVSNLEQAYNIDPKAFSATKIKKKLNNVRLQYGDQLIKENAKQSAINQYKAVLKLDSTNVQGLAKLGDLYVDLGFLNQAEIQFQKSLKNNKNDVKLLNSLNDIKQRTLKADKYCAEGKKYFEKYSYQKAVKQLEKALKQKADHKDAKYYHAMAKGAYLYKKGGKSDCWEALEYFGKAMAIHPKSGEPHYYMGLTYEKKDRREFDNAIQEYETVLKKEPDSKFVKDSKIRIKKLAKLRDKLKDFWGK